MVGVNYNRGYCRHSAKTTTVRCEKYLLTIANLKSSVFINKLQQMHFTIFVYIPFISPNFSPFDPLQSSPAFL